MKFSVSIFVTLLVASLGSFSFAQMPSIVINEIMYAPTSPEPEWVEIYNTTRDSINLKNWKISDNTLVKATIVTKDCFIQPLGYVIVAKDSNIFAVHPSIPAPVLKVNFPALNNTGDAVVLYDSTGRTIDSLAYTSSWGGQNGYSLERKLSSEPSTQQSNWGTSSDIERSTPGRKNSIALRVFDLAVKELTLSPQFPIAGDNVTIFAKIVNRGSVAVSDYTVEFFNDVNGDSIPQPTERIQLIASTGTLAPGDSAIFSASLVNIPAGETRIIVRVNLTDDEYADNNTGFSTITGGIPPHSLVINEIMYAPGSGEPEWVELYNTMGNSINLKNWKLSDNNTAAKVTIIVADFSFSPQSYVVLSKDSSILSFHNTIPSPVVKMSLPTLNNDVDAVVLYDQRGAVIDSLTYFSMWGGNSGHSLERIDALAASTDSVNWGSSTDAEKSTPGKKNSIARADLDVALRRIFFVPETPQQGQPVSINAVVQNVGRKSATGFTVQAYFDANRDSIREASELIGSSSFSNVLNANDSTTVLIPWSSPPSGINRVIVVINYAQDERVANNSAVAEVKVGCFPNSVVINEIMYAPLANQSEYVELYNRSTNTVNLLNWKLSDMPTASGANIFTILSSVVLQRNEYVVIAADSSILNAFSYLKNPSLETHVIILNKSSLGLNNDEDDVTLRDVIGATIDSVHYSDKWQNSELVSTTGIALERINPNSASNDRRNWNSSANSLGGTPGKQNSIFTETLPSQSKITISPNPFSPDGDGFEDFTIISYQLPMQISQVRMKIFDVKGRLVRTLMNNELSGSTGQVVWDGLDDNKQKLRMGIYIIFIEALDAGGGVVETAKAAVVVAGKL